MVRHSTKIVSIVSLLCFLGSLIIFGVFYGMVSKQKTDHLTHAQGRAEAIIHKESLQKLMQVLDETKVERESLYTRIVADDEMINLIELIETIGEEQGVVLTTESLDTAPINEYFESFIINLGVKGSYTQIIQTLSLLEKLPYQVTILNTGLQRGDDGVWYGSVGVSVTKFMKNEN